MLKTLAAIFFCIILANANLYSQKVKLDNKQLVPVKVFMSLEKLSGQEVVKVIRDSTVMGADEPTFVKIRGIDFRDGIIEVMVLSRLLKNAPESARGFIGVAFRIDDSNSKFECIYIRPTNGRADDQVRRNHSIQYFSFPDFKFDRLRKEAPEKYESYADMGLNEWIKMKIEVKGNKAKLFLNNNKQPSLIVNDLKLGSNSSGSIGLWLDIGTEAFFRDLKVYKD